MAVPWALLALGVSAVRVDDDCGDAKGSLLLNGLTAQTQSLLDAGGDAPQIRGTRSSLVESKAPAELPPVVKGAWIFGRSIGWTGHEAHPNGVVDRNKSTIWTCSDIPAVIDIQFPMHYRLEDMRLINDVVDGADQVKLHAYSGGSWRYVQTFKFQVGEDKVVELDAPVVTRKVRLEFPTYHMDGVAVRDVMFYGQDMDNAWKHHTKDYVLDYNLTATVDTDDIGVCPLITSLLEKSLEGLSRWANKIGCSYCATIDDKVFVKDSTGWLGTMPSYDAGWPNIHNVTKHPNASEASGTGQWDFQSEGVAGENTHAVSIKALRPTDSVGRAPKPKDHSNNQAYGSQWYKKNQSPKKNWTDWRHVDPSIDVEDNSKAWGQSEPDESTSLVQLSEQTNKLVRRAQAMEPRVLATDHAGSEEVTFKTKCAALACYSFQLALYTKLVHSRGSEKKDVRCAAVAKHLCQKLAHNTGCPHMEELCTGNATTNCIAEDREFRAYSLDSLPEHVINADPELKQAYDQSFPVSR